MKKLLIISLLNIIITQLTFGQKNDTSQPSTNGGGVSPVSNGGLYVGSGASVHIAGSGSLTLENSILENKGTVTDATGTILITGNSTTGIKIGGIGQTSLHHLTINKSAGDLNLEKNISVAGDLTLNSGNVSLVSGNVDFGSTGKIIGESETTRVLGTGGFLQTTVDLNAPNEQNPANLGAIISSPANLGSTIIKRVHDPKTVYSNSTTTGIQRSYDIAPANNSSLNAGLKLIYLDAELNSNPEAALKMWKSEDQGSNWNSLPSTVDATTNQLQVTGQQALGLYTGHINCPTITATANSPLCEAENLRLSVQLNDIDPSSTATYAWSGPNSFSSNEENPTISGITPSGAGQYTVTVVTNGCSVNTTVDVTVHPLPDIPTITADNMSICKGRSAVLTGNCSTANSSFRWTTPEFINGNQTSALPSSNIRTVNEPGIYKGLCESDKGCLSAEVSINITQGLNCNGLNFITITPEKPAICPGETITMNASGCTGTLTWLGGTTTPTGASVNLSPASSTTYLVQCSSGGTGTFNLIVAQNTLAVTNNVTTGKERFKAVTTLTSDKKIGDANFTPGANVIYEAGNSITLLPGFTAEKWSTFKAEIKTCNNVTADE